MSTNFKIALSIGFVLAAVSVAAARPHPSNIRSSQLAVSYAQVPILLARAPRISAQEQRWFDHQNLGLSYGYPSVR